MHRRHFSLQLASAAMLVGWGTVAPAVWAEGGSVPVEGKDFIKLKQPVQTAGTGKIEVVEFFWYGCPHCSLFEPILAPWIAKLPADVSFRRVPVSFNDVRKEFRQRLFYALEAMGQVGALHAKVFARFHTANKPIDRDTDAAAFAQENGLDPAKFTQLLDSFSVRTKMRQADQLSNAYNIDGVPTLGFQGRYLTSPSAAGGLDKAIAVADYLINLLRKSG